MKTSKFYISLFIGTLLFLFFHFENLKAETAICEPDCFDTPFHREAPLSVTFCFGNCCYAADFYIRKACGIWCDILLWRVRALDSNCNNYDPKMMCDIAEAQIIHFLINDYNQNGTNSIWFQNYWISDL